MAYIYSCKMTYIYSCKMAYIYSCKMVLTYNYNDGVDLSNYGYFHGFGTFYMLMKMSAGSKRGYARVVPPE